MADGGGSGCSDRCTGMAQLGLANRWGTVDKGIRDLVRKDIECCVLSNYWVGTCVVRRRKIMGSKDM
jgi:hypothetical protein